MTDLEIEKISSMIRSYLIMYKEEIKKEPWYIPEPYTDGILSPAESEIKSESTEMLTAAAIRKHVEHLAPDSMLTINLDYSEGT